MTCEVAVMNKRGIALAADSAVTIGQGDKIYHHAEKLFSLRSDAPVGIMIYGSAEIMAMPWELVINSYARQLGERRFDRLDQYAQEFLRFVESSASLFPTDLQLDWFRGLVGRYWKDQLSGPLATKLKQKSKNSSRTANGALAELLKEDHSTWKKYRTIKQLGIAYGDKVISEYGSALDKLEKEIFGAYTLSQEVREGLRNTVKFMYMQQWFHPHDRSWIVFAGMGEAEPFPVLQEYRVGSIAAGRLRSFKSNEASVSREESAIVVPLAQTEMIDMFYRGVIPELDEKLDEIVTRCVSRETMKQGEKPSPKQVKKIQRAFRKALEDEIDEKYKEPLIAAVDALPRHDLAKMAETLVNLTAFRKRMSVEQKETVGGSIDVAICQSASKFDPRSASNFGSDAFLVQHLSLSAYQPGLKQIDFAAAVHLPSNEF
jgi:hypothetical protein